MEAPDTTPRSQPAGWLRHGLTVVFSFTLLFTAAACITYLPASQRLLIAATPVDGFGDDERFTAVKGILSYYSTGDAQLLAGYTRDEQAHLAEVAGVIKKAWRIYATCLIVTLIGFTLIIRRHGFPALRGQLRYACKVSAISSLLALLIGWLGFEPLFDYFHRRVFSAAPWQFDPSVSRLVNEFPPDYFRAAVAATLVMACATGVVGWLILNWRINKKTQTDARQSGNSLNSDGD